MIEIHCFDEDPNGPALVLRVEPPITARRLIRRRIRHEVDLHNLKRDKKVFRGLIQPVDAIPTSSGWRLRRPRAIDPLVQIEAALRAYEHHDFFLLFEGRRVDGLDDAVQLVEGAAVSFVKLCPLVAG